MRERPRADGRPRGATDKSGRTSVEGPGRPPVVGAGAGRVRGVPALTAQRQESTSRSLLALYRPDLSAVLDDRGAPQYRYAQVCEHLLLRPRSSLAEATVLPRELRERLDALGGSTLDVVASREAADGTVKLLVEGRDGARFETVLMPYRDRVTVCLSSQVGCPVGCAFCATGAMGFRRNLTVAEMVDQVRAAAGLAAEQRRRVSNLVYMGMGEPLLNLRPVLDSIRVLTDPLGMGLAHRAVSVSTVGIPSGILKLARAHPQVNLALSLHAADDVTRARLIPARFRHPIADVLEAARGHFAITHRKLLVEYVLLRGINDSADDARRLAGLLRGHVVTVNLLGWNSFPHPSGMRPLSPNLPAEATSGPGRGALDRFAAPPRSVVVEFRDTLARAGIEAVIRQSKGAGIQAACGQLAGSCQGYSPLSPAESPLPRRSDGHTKSGTARRDGDT